RPCRRCDPRGTGPAARRREIVTRACELLDGPDAPPSLQALAREVGMSPYHLHRVFKAQTGITPQAYRTARRMARARRQLAEGSEVTAAIYDAGFGSNGRFYEAASERLGMQPRQLRAGAPG